MEEPAAQVVEEFRSRVGREPVAVGSAPGRVNLIGEHVDYNGGSVLPIALTSRTFVALAPRPDRGLVVHSLQQSEVTHGSVDDQVEGWAAYVAGVLWALDPDGPGYDVVVDGRVPLGAGLSSSAALECAVAVAATHAVGEPRDREDLVQVCVRAENDYVGAATGSMDQTIAMLAEADHALLVDFGSGRRRLVPWRPPGGLLVIDTRAAHELVGSEYAERRRTCEDAAAHLGVPHLAAATVSDLELLPDPLVRRRAQHVVTEVARVAQAVEAIEAEDWPGLGGLMTASHESLRDDYEVTVPELDVAVEAALEAGAWGARMTGGGFGGSAIALLRPGTEGAVRDAVESAFEASGFRPPAFVDGTAGGPAEGGPVDARR